MTRVTLSCRPALGPLNPTACTAERDEFLSVSLCSASWTLHPTRTPPTLASWGPAHPPRPAAHFTVFPSGSWLTPPTNCRLQAGKGFKLCKRR